MQSILIFGSTGSLGKILARYLIKKKFKVFTDQKYKTKLKKNNGSKLFEKIIERTNPNYIVNLVALTNVDLCEKNKKLANNLSGIIINFYNLIIFLIGINYYNNTEIMIILTLFNVFFYLICYFRILSVVRNSFKK